MSNDDYQRLMQARRAAAKLLGQAGGSVKSEAKTRAAQENAKRPRPGGRGKRKRIIPS